jgi:opacity protein-like surface antigen
MKGIVGFVDELGRSRRCAATSEGTKPMGNLRLLAAAASAVILATPSARAADLGPPPPTCATAPMMPGCQPIVEYSGWYLRGDIGMSNQRVSSLDNVVNAGTTVTTQFLTFDSAPIFDIGIGYQLNNWLRFDFTGEYRANAHFHGQQVASFGAIILPDDYHASKHEWLFLANAYLDLGTWWNLTPFVGVGIGGSYNTISSFTDIGATQVGATILSTTYGAEGSKWNFAWAAYAGLSYQVTPTFAVEMSYRYLSLGGATTGPTNSFDGQTVVNGTPFVFKDLTSQDVRIGFRWMFMEPPPPPPLMRRG